MKLFKLELERGRKGKDVLVHAETEQAAKARALAKFTGWQVRGEVHEIAGEAHFVLADLEEGEWQPDDLEIALNLLSELKTPLFTEDWSQDFIDRIDALLARHPER